MTIRGAIFDFDGTLFDSMGIWETAGTDYLASLGITAQADLAKTLHPLSMLQSTVYLQEHYSLPLSLAEIEDGINRIVEDYYLLRTQPKDGVLPFLSALKARGVPMCIATASDRYLVEGALKRCGLLPFFEEIFTCSQLGRSKDEPFIFEHARQYLGTSKAETAVFEDAPHAAKTAKDAGFPVIGIFDAFEPNQQALKTIADVYAGSFAQLQSLLSI